MPEIIVHAVEGRSQEQKRALMKDITSRTRAPAIAQPEDRNVYELHVRDFSIGDETVPAVSGCVKAR